MITGGIKFFTKNRLLSTAGGEIEASSGELVASAAIDKNPATFWTSVGSNDSTEETLTLTFPESLLDRLFLINHNFKGFTVKYWDEAEEDWADFANVVGLDGSKANITETAFADDTAYYEFTAVTTTKLQIKVTTAQTTNAEKFLCLVVGTTEIGTLQGYPDISPLMHNRNERTKKMLSGKSLVQKGIDSVAFKLDFSPYPASLSGDIDLVMELFDSEDPFHVWLCGGRRGAAYFKKTLRGYRLQDLYLMQTVKPVQVAYRKNTYLNPIETGLALEEHV